MDVQTAFDELYNRRSARAIVFREAISTTTFQPDIRIPAGVRYRDVGFDWTRGVLYPEARVEVLIWLRDWFKRSSDETTGSELADMIRRIKGDVQAGDPEHYSRFIVDGTAYKYDSHAFDERPDGVLFAAIVILQVA